MLIKKKYFRLVLFHHFYRHFLTVYLFHFHCCIRLTKFSDVQSFYFMSKVRSVFVYTLKILMKLVNFRHLKIGRRSRSRERERSFKLTYLPTTNLLKIKFTFRRSFQTQQLLLTKECDRETVLTGIRARSGIPALTDTI